jgi:hypothetical protein
MKRRAFLAGIGAALMSPVVVSAQQPDASRTVGFLANFRSDDSEGRVRVDSFNRAIQQLGWREGANLHTEIRWPGDDIGLTRQYAQELVDLKPDVILAWATPSVSALQRLTRSACELKPRCCPKMPARKVPRSIHELARDVARDIAKTDAYVRSRRERKKIEMLFAHLKRILRLDCLRLRGPLGAQDEFLLAATAQNLRKLAKLILPPALKLA